MEGVVRRDAHVRGTPRPIEGRTRAYAACAGKRSGRHGRRSTWRPSLKTSAPIPTATRAARWSVFTCLAWSPGVKP